MRERKLLTGPSPRQLTALYVIALSLVAALSLTGQALVQFSLRQQMNDSRVVNIAGRQRMLSQRIAKCMLQLVRTDESAASSSNDAAVRAARIEELQRSANLLRRCHLGLRDGDPQLHLPGNNSVTVQRMFADIDPACRQLQTAAVETVKLLLGDTAVLRPTLLQLCDQVLAAEKVYLAGMDRIVFQYDREARARVSQLRTIEKFLLATTLLVLTLEGCLIFRPAIRRIRHSIDTLQSATERLAVARDEAQRANAAKSQFLSTLSHELRTPMNAIVGLTDQLLDTKIAPAQKKMLGTVQRGARTMTELLTDLLHASQWESSTLPPVDDQAVDIVELTEQSLELVRPALPASDLELRWHYEASRPRVFQTDPGRLQQVLLNLLTNAIKYTPQGFVELRLSARPLTDDDHTMTPPAFSSSRFPAATYEVTITVEDSGIGIPEEQHERIFQSFTQLSAARPLDAGGVGLGLFVSSKIVTAMGGTISVKSVPNQGSTFQIMLPLQESRQCQPAVSPSLPQLRDHHENWWHHRLLIAEDNPANQMVLTGYLDRLGCRYQMVEDGQRAVAAYREGSFDLVLMDLSMPQMSGIDASRIISQRSSSTASRQVPIIGITAYVDTDLRAAGERAGICDWLTKPLVAEQLVETLRRHLPDQPSDGDGPSLTSPTPQPGAVPEGLYAKLRQAAIEYLPPLMNQLSQAVDQQERERIAFLSHRICGTIAYLEVPEIADLCHELESAANHGPRGQIEPLCASLLASLESLLDRLHGRYDV